MESLSRSLNYQQAFQTEPNFDKYAQQILENSKLPPGPTNPPAAKINNLLQEFGASFINSIQLQNFQKTLHTNRSSATNAVAAHAPQLFNSTLAANHSSEMEIEFIPNQIIIDSSSFDSMDELQKQLEYDKFMNEVWIGIVLTLILISMIFCICSCFLYHQFRTWKRNYHSTVVQSQAADIESLKLQSDPDDPVPEYTLVSGLPSYEAALELLHKPPAKSCLIVYPSVFGIFNKNEKLNTTTTTMANNSTNTSTTSSPLISVITQQQQQQHQQHQHIVDLTTPLLDNSTTTTTMINNLPNTPTAITTTTTTPSFLKGNPLTVLHNVNETTHNIESNSILDFTISKSNEKELLELLNESTITTTPTTTTMGITEKPLEEANTGKREKGK